MKRDAIEADVMEAWFRESETVFGGMTISRRRNDIVLQDDRLTVGRIFVLLERWHVRSLEHAGFNYLVGANIAAARDALVDLASEHRRFRRF